MKKKIILLLVLVLLTLTGCATVTQAVTEEPLQQLKVAQKTEVVESVAEEPELVEEDVEEEIQEPIEEKVLYTLSYNDTTTYAGNDYDEMLANITDENGDYVIELLENRVEFLGTLPGDEYPSREVWRAYYVFGNIPECNSLTIKGCYCDQNNLILNGYDYIISTIYLDEDFEVNFDLTILDCEVTIANETLDLNEHNLTIGGNHACNLFGNNLVNGTLIIHPEFETQLVFEGLVQVDIIADNVGRSGSCGHTIYFIGKGDSVLDLGNVAIYDNVQFAIEYEYKSISIDTLVFGSYGIGVPNLALKGCVCSSGLIINKLDTDWHTSYDCSKMATIWEELWETAPVYITVKETIGTINRLNILYTTGGIITWQRGDGTVVDEFDFDFNPPYNIELFSIDGLDKINEIGLSICNVECNDMIKIIDGNKFMIYNPDAQVTIRVDGAQVL